MTKTNALWTAPRRDRAGILIAMLSAVTIACATAQAAAPTALHVVTSSSAQTANKTHGAKHRVIVSPYARAAAARAREAQNSAARAPTRLNAMGRLHSTHGAGGHK